MKGFFRGVLGLAVALVLGWPLSGQEVPGPATTVLWVTGTTVAETGGVYAANSGESWGVVAAAGAVVNLVDAEVTVSGYKGPAGPLGGAAGVLALAGAKVNFSGGSVRSSGPGDAGFAVAGEGTSLTVSGTTVSTSGPQSPAIRTAPGASIVVTGGTAKTTGEGAPAIEAGGSVKVTGAVLVATGAEAVVLTGGSGVILENTVLVGGPRGVVFHPGAGTFRLTGGALTAIGGPLFTTEGSGAIIDLREAVVTQNSGWLVRMSTPGSATLNADHQTLAGDVVGAPGTSLSVNLRDGSRWTGAVGPGGPSVDVTIDPTSEWLVTADTVINILSVRGDVTEAVRGLLGGHRVSYKASANGWLNGRTIDLADGGSLVPY